MSWLSRLRGRLAHELFCLAAWVTDADGHAVKGLWSWVKEDQSFRGSVLVKVHDASISKPDMSDDRWAGRVAIVFDGCVVSATPLGEALWKADHEVGHHRPFVGVSTWLEFPDTVRKLFYEDGA